VLGSLPDMFDNLTGLSVLDISNNRFTGMLNSFKQLFSSFLPFFVNKSPGTLPSSLTRLVNLEALYLGYNFFTGTNITKFLDYFRKEVIYFRSTTNQYRSYEFFKSF
jgi:hypothetical protein